MGVQWHNSLSIGIEEIDAQHRELISRFDGLLKACEAGVGALELRNMLRFLDDYAVRHFTDEEALQRRCGYPEFEKHRGEHQTFIDNLRKLRQRVEAEGPGAYQVIEANNMLIKWLMNHISESDGAIGKWMRKPARG